MNQLLDKKNRLGNWIEEGVEIWTEEYKEVLQEMSDEELVQLHQKTKWLSPTYELRKRYPTLEEVKEDIVLSLAQVKTPRAKEQLMEIGQSCSPKCEDETLVVAAQNGNRQAYEMVTIKYMGFVRGVVQSMKSRGYYFRGYQTEDLVQEGMIGLFKSISDFKVERRKKFKEFANCVIRLHIKTLILKLTNNKNKSYNESLSCHSPIGNDSEITFEQMMRSNIGQPEKIYFHKITYELIKEKLTPMETQVLDMRKEGYSYADIAETLGQKKKAVDNAVQRIRKKVEKLKKQFE